MGDMTIIYSQQCKSNSIILFTSTNGKYQILWSYNYGWKCSCPAWQYGGTRPCKHIKALKICGWHKEYDGNPPQSRQQEKQYICPRCGGETEIIRIAI